MSRNSNSTSALVVLQDRELTYTQEQLPKLQTAALAQIAMVRQLEREGAARAIMAGLTLHRVKASLKRGEFLPWIKGSVKGVGYAQCNFYMRLAGVFVGKAKVSKPDLLALPGDQTELALDGGEGQARDFFAKLSRFVGECSLNELLDKHGIKTASKLGGLRETGDNGEDAAPALVDPEILRSQSMDEIGSAWERTRTLLIKENRLQHFVGRPEDIQAIVTGFRSLADEIERAAKPLLTKTA
jgi:hypothetical protein